MNKKKILIAFSLIILCVLAPCMYLSYASQTTSVGFTPSYIASKSVGSTFTVSIQISDVTNLTAWTVSLAWDPSILQMQGNPTQGPFLKTVGSTVFVPAGLSNTLGVFQSLSCLMLSNNGASGTGILAQLSFSVVNTGACQINITSSEFDTTDSSGNYVAIPVTISNATFTTAGPPTPAHGPTANFTPVDGSTFQLDTMLQLNASSSQPGYDTQTCPITNYFWSIEYLNGTTFTSLTGETPTFNVTVSGTFRVILIVTANDTQASPAPGYSSTNSTSALINVISSAQSVDIDVFTDKGGPEAEGGSYGPLQLVQMYASVTYQNLLMPDENVVFSVQNSTGSVIAMKQGFTNQTGIASADFRLPTPDPTTPQYGFGTWSITASVNILNTSVNDTTTFTFNYQSGIENITIPASVHRSETLPIQLTINNEYISEQWTQLSITLFDQAGIPIGSTTVTTTQQTQNITVIDTAITIPSWAFTGQATAYICLLTNSTNTQYTPVAPETTATFQILS
jgi:hypothetical protein